jgi:hypothetical protein
MELPVGRVVRLLEGERPTDRTVARLRQSDVENAAILQRLRE